MDKERIIHLLKNPNEVGAQDRFLIQECIDELPYFQPLRLLLLRTFKEKNYPIYRQALQKASIYSPNRDVLYDFVYESKDFREPNAPEVAAQIKIQDDAEESIPSQENKDSTEADITETPKEPISSEEVIVPAAAALGVAGLASDNRTEELREDAAEQGTDANDAIEDTSEHEATHQKEEDHSNTHSEIETPIEADFPNIADPSLEAQENEPENQVEAIDQEEKEEVFEENPIKSEEARIAPLSQSKTAHRAKEQKSFLDWLQEPQETFQSEADRKRAIIERFIAEQPKISKPTTKETTEVVPVETKEDFSMVTETLGNIFVEQQKYEKAIEVFEKLKLKYPEKSLFFADRISEIREKI